MIQMVVFILMTAVAVALLLLPLWRRRDPADARAFDLEVYRDQLAELERDRERGLIQPEQARAARLEIERRILGVAGRPGGADAASGRASLAPWVSAALALALPLFVAGIYLAIGAPNLPDQPLASRDLGPPAGGDGHERLLADAEQLEEHLKTTPPTAGVYMALGRTRLALGEMPEALKAYREGLKLAPEDGAVEAELGEALIYASNGMVTPEAIGHFESALAKQAGEPRARYYLGLAAAQAGRLDEAFGAWRALLKESPASAPWRESVAEGIVTFALNNGRDPAMLLKDLPEAHMAARNGLPQPSAEDQAAMAELPPEERNAQIRGMVDRLAARLADDPSDVDGWLNLARSRTVLGEREAARMAYERALEQLKPDDPRRATVEAQLAAFDAGGGQAPSAAAEAAPESAAEPAAATTASSMPQPSAEDQAAMAALPADQQSAQIRAMVDGLAARLEENPEDVDGWLNLARSRAVLGEADAAKEAYRRALEIAPDSPDVLKAYAHSLLGAVDPRTNTTAVGEEAVGIYQKVVGMLPDDPEAHWYLGLAAVQQDRLDQAAEHWGVALAALSPEHPNYAGIAASLEEIKRQIGGADGKDGGSATN
jgi:cytochrome c-type biogenesis protein CcmH